MSKKLIKKLNFFLPASKLEEYGFERKIYFLENCPYNIEATRIIYFIPRTREFFHLINQQYDLMYNKLQLERKKGNYYYPETSYSIIMFPNVDLNIVEPTISSKNLSQLYIPENYTFYNFPLDIFPLDYDLLSLEDENSFQNLFLNNDISSLVRLSEIIAELEILFGKIQSFYYKGDKSKQLYNLILKRENEENIKEDPLKNEEILSCIIIDRNIDYITPFITQFNYEGIIDDYFGIDLNSIEVDQSIIPNKENKSNIIYLDYRDPLYYMIKDYNFNKIRQFLPKRLKMHSSILERGKKLKDFNGISKNLTLVKQINNESKSLLNHIDIAQFISNKLSHPNFKRRLLLEQIMLSVEFENKEIFEYYENEIGKKGNLYSLLQMIIIQCQINGGLKEKIYNNLKKEISLIYGFQNLLLLTNLEKLKIIKKRDGNDFYKILNKKLELIKKDVNINQPNDASYVYGGYCPISIRLIENIFKKGWFGIKEILNKIPGETFFPNDENFLINPKYNSNNILLVFIGGITYSEIACIRYLNKEFPKMRFFILTTSVVNAKRIFDNLNLNLSKKEIYTHLDFLNNLENEKQRKK
jgi:hypothetical protein